MAYTNGYNPYPTNVSRQTGALQTILRNLEPESPEAIQIQSRIAQLQQQDALGGLYTVLGNLEPESPEAQQIQARIGAITNQDPTISSLFTILQNLEPESPEAQQIQARIFALQNGGGPACQSGVPQAGSNPMMGMMLKMMNQLSMMLQQMGRR